jgi:TPP-dependent pyruvate/acetoin dehydrogenase alpha subunit
MFDAELYRTREEVERWKERCPIDALAAVLAEQGVLTDEIRARIEREIEAEIDAAVAFAEAGTWEPVGELTRYVYSERVPA